LLRFACCLLLQAIFCRRRFGISQDLPANHGFSLSKQKADNASEDGVENRADHHAAHSAEQHEDVGLTKQHPDHQSPDEGAKDAGDRSPGKARCHLSHSLFAALLLLVIVGTSALACWLVGAWPH
jgi:hypothetical protein